MREAVSDRDMVRNDVVATAGLNASASSTRSPIYFGAADRPLFGWWHQPVDGWSGTSIVLCSALGYEGLFAHPTLRELAQQLATSVRANVLRFDYDGVGDSAGSDEDPDRVSAWLNSIDSAIDAVRQRTSARGRVILVGLRAGALLAAEVAARRGDIDALVLWAPCVSGREFAREQRAFALLAHASAAGASAKQIDWGKGGFEANGYVFASETVARLGQLSIDSAQVSPSPKVLVVDRDESPARTESFRRWEAAGASVDRVVIHDYAAMIEPPLTMQLPSATMAAITDWVRRVAPFDRQGEVLPEAGESAGARVAPGVIEESTWYADDARFGILTVPEGRQVERVMVFLNNASGNRVGPHGMVPMTARLLASHGVASLRIDFGGVGDSELPAGRPAHHPYDLTPVEDVRAAVAFLRGRGFTHIAAGGLCSAAFLAWHAAQSVPEIDQLVLINPQTFEWKEGDSLDVSPLQQRYDFDSYRQSARSLEKWRKLIRGKVAIGHLTRLLSKQARFTVSSRLQSIRARLGIGGKHSRASKVLHAVGRRGGRVSVVFSSGDPGISNLERELAGTMRSSLRRGSLSVQVIDGPDHSFTPRWATRRLNDAIARELVAACDSASRE